MRQTISMNHDTARECLSGKGTHTVDHTIDSTSIKDRGHLEMVPSEHGHPTKMAIYEWEPRS